MKKKLWRKLPCSYQRTPAAAALPEVSISATAATRPSARRGPPRRTRALMLRRGGGGALNIIDRIYLHIVSFNKRERLERLLQPDSVSALSTGRDKMTCIAELFPLRASVLWCSYQFIRHIRKLEIVMDEKQIAINRRCKRTTLDSDCVSG